MYDIYSYFSRVVVRQNKKRNSARKFGIWFRSGLEVVFRDSIYDYAYLIGIAFFE